MAFIGIMAGLVFMAFLFIAWMMTGKPIILKTILFFLVIVIAYGLLVTYAR